MSSELNEFLNYGIKYINKNLDLKKLKRKYAGGEDRTLLLNILAPTGRSTGFYIDKDFKLKMGSVVNPTVEVQLTEATFWDLIAQKKSVVEAFFDGSLNLVGEAVLRDFLIFRELMNTLGKQLLEKLA